MKVYDSDIRELLKYKFITLKKYTSDPTTKVVEEMDVCMGTSRIDMAVLNGKLHGYEIKSEQDTLERLPDQIESYNKIFDTMTIVTGEKHVSKVMKIVPDWWGVYYVSLNKKKPVLKRKRQVKKNKEIDIFYLSQLLWKNELCELLIDNGIKKGIKSKTRYELGILVSKVVNNHDTKEYVREKLKSRKDWKAVELKQLYDDLQQ
ncbi:hypothetical protein SH1V18_03190 [Vallitalea longa]|uniref:Sce7726 family protein n=1 Tax=Vallitalea longa TaxID=2936439 RepID=A0A9W5Y7R5_9FIRM|nr:sce7726 family protein [Vallitalea longa]GKX27839.1 hypothetical protein SH1V18_03190 [Vallitalea longa]